MFQSTSSEEDVVSDPNIVRTAIVTSFNPRPPKRTLCHRFGADAWCLTKFQSTSSEEDVVSSHMAP